MCQVIALLRECGLAQLVLEAESHRERLGAHDRLSVAHRGGEPRSCECSVKRRVIERPVTAAY
jgi:hypothetical protein